MSYAMYGALLGATVPVIGTLVRAAGGGSGISWEAVGAAQRDPLLWLLDLMPAITTIVGLIVGAMRDRLSLANAMLVAARNDVRVATRALADSAQQSEVRQADLTRAENDLTRFVQVASHDLRAPLQAINSLAEWVREDLGDHLTPEGRQHLKLLRLRAARMGKLLSSLQAYTLAGQEAGAIEPVDVKLLAHQVLQQVPGGNRFIMTFDGTVDPLHTSRSSLSTVLYVLLDNCVRHHDMSPGRIFLERRDAGQVMQLVVADDGPGIPDDFHDKVFGLFVTLHRRDDMETSGSGLAVARRVVETYGGKIEVLPQDGRGTRIRFTWPTELTAQKHSADALARLSLKTLSAKRDVPASQR